MEEFNIRKQGLSMIKEESLWFNHNQPVMDQQ